jgi:hypothetical protein
MKSRRPVGVALRDPAPGGWISASVTSDSSPSVAERLRDALQLERKGSHVVFPDGYLRGRTLRLSQPRKGRRGRAYQGARDPRTEAGATAARPPLGSLAKPVRISPVLLVRHRNHHCELVPPAEC